MLEQNGNIKNTLYKVQSKNVYLTGVLDSSYSEL